MAGPRPMPNQPPIYPQQNYGPPPGYPQYPQKKGSSGVLKGCIIAAIVIFILGGAVVAMGVGAAWFGISKASEMFDKEVDQAVVVSDDFMKKLAAGDIKGAHALCESGISEQQLDEFAKAYEKVLKGNKGLKYNTLDIMGIQLRGNVNVHNDEAHVMLNPADVIDQSGVQVAFTLRRASGTSTYKVLHVAITGFTPTEGGGSLGSAYHAPTRSGSKLGD